MHPTFDQSPEGSVPLNATAVSRTDTLPSTGPPRGSEGYPLPLIPTASAPTGVKARFWSLSLGAERRHRTRPDAPAEASQRRVLPRRPHHALLPMVRTQLLIPSFVAFQSIRLVGTALLAGFPLLKSWDRSRYPRTQGRNRRSPHIVLITKGLTGATFPNLSIVFETSRTYAAWACA